MNCDDIMYMDKDRIRKDYCNEGDDLYGICSFTPMQDSSYLFKNELISCVVCNPFDKVYTMKMERSLYDIYHCITFDRHYDSLSYLTASKKYKETNDALDISWVVFADVLNIACRKNIYPTSCTTIVDNAPLSIILVSESGMRFYCYDTAVIFGKHVTSLPRELQWYILGNATFIKNKSFGNTVTTILYEDSIKKIVSNISKEELNE